MRRRQCSAGVARSNSSGGTLLSERDAGPPNHTTVAASHGSDGAAGISVLRNWHVAYAGLQLEPSTSRSGMSGCPDLPDIVHSDLLLTPSGFSDGPFCLRSPIGTDTAAIFAAAGFRLGPLRALLSLLPVVRDPSDFEDRRIRVLQSVSLVSLCCGIYSAIPDHARTQQGWKQNLVTMETSMASGIAATYGYSVAGGIPGGLLAEYVMSYMGKHAVPEVADLIGTTLAKAIVSASLFAVMGMYMEWLAICGYAYAHRMHPGSRRWSQR